MARLGESVICNFSLSDHKKIIKTSNLFPCFRNYMVNWENLIKIGRAGGNTSNREGWNV